MMTFEELKYEVVNRIRTKETDKLLWLYTKAQNYTDIIKAVKATGNFKWILKNGFRELVNEIPPEILIQENIIAVNTSLIDVNDDIIVLDGITLNITMNNQNRCRIISDGGFVNATINDSAMIEFETFQSNRLSVETRSYGYAFITCYDRSLVQLFGYDNSTFAISAFSETRINAELNQNSFPNVQLYDSAQFQVNTGNYYARQNDKTTQIIR